MGTRKLQSSRVTKQVQKNSFIKAHLHETHVGVRQLHYQHSHDFEHSETHFSANFTLVKLTEVKFQTTVSFPCKQ